MPAARPNTLGLSRRTLKVLIALNLAVGAFILALLLASFVWGDSLFGALGVQVTADSGALVVVMRLIMVIGVVSTPLAHVILARLLGIVLTVSAGDPFVSENASRLQTIAWALLGLEALHFAVGAISASVSTAAQPIDLDWNFSFTRWIAVLLLFVLARVFEQGARMREDLEGTV